jgi:hypothetical protein
MELFKLGRGRRAEDTDATDYRRAQCTVPVQGNWPVVFTKFIEEITPKYDLMITMWVLGVFGSTVFNTSQLIQPQ